MSHFTDGWPLAPLKSIVRAGKACIDWFNDTGTCHFCDVDAEREKGGPPKHEGWCPLNGTEGKR